MEVLANELLEKKYPFQTFFQQVASLLEHPHPEFIERIRFKSSFEFVRQLNKYFIHLENNSFTHTELRVAGVVVPFPFIVQKFKAWQRMPMHKRIRLGLARSLWAMDPRSGRALLVARQALHEATGCALEENYAGRLEEQFELLSHHFTRSGNREKALEYLMQEEEE